VTLFEKMNFPPLYVLTDPIFFREKSFRNVMEEALVAGARFIQYRAKGLSAREGYREAQLLRNLTERYDALLIVNDSVDLALAVGADGVHLGQEDLPVSSARRLLGRDRIIGLSTHDVEEAEAAQAEGADYIGLGPIYPTKTKETGRAPMGPEGIRQVRKMVGLPIYAIGGITLDRLSEVLASGADGVAVISSLAGKMGENIAGWLAGLDRGGSRQNQDCS
jgi:thiamine-phosphate pyrophosphorylase